MLVKYVLSGIPLHYMQAFKIRKGVLWHIDRIRKNFLWKGNESCKGINCLVNWDKVCALKINGGLSIFDQMALEAPAGEPWSLGENSATAIRQL